MVEADLAGLRQIDIILVIDYHWARHTEEEGAGEPRRSIPEHTKLIQLSMPATQSGNPHIMLSPTMCLG